MFGLELQSTQGEANSLSTHDILLTSYYDTSQAIYTTVEDKLTNGLVTDVRTVRDTVTLLVDVNALQAIGAGEQTTGRVAVYGLVKKRLKK